jgi:hypothetical protein
MKRFACALLVVVAAAGVAVAAEDEKNGQVTLSMEMFKNITGWDGKAKPGEIVIPWEEVRKLLDVDVQGMGGATVKLPWKQFRSLVEWSIARKGGVDATPPPTDYVVTNATFSGTLGKKVANFTADLKVNVLRKKGWKRIGVMPAGVALSKAEVKDGHLNVRGGTYEILTQATGEMPVKLEFAAAVEESAGKSTVSFSRVPSGTCLLDLTVPSQDVTVRVAGGQLVQEKAVGDGKQMLFALSGTNQVRIEWEREIKEVAKVDPKLYAQTQTLVAVGEGLVTGRQRVVYSIVHAGVRELSLKVPEGLNVLDVSTSYLHDWRVKDGTLLVRLSREVRGVHRLDVSFEKAVTGNAVDAPALTTLGTERERGHVAVVALANVEISAKPEKGATGVDVSSLPPELVGQTSQPVLLGFRTVGRDFRVPLNIARHEDVKVLVTVIDAATFTVMQTLDGRRVVSAVYDVRNNRNQFLRIKMPANCEVWSVSVAGKAAKPARDDAGMTLVPLVRSSGQQLTAFPVEIVYIDPGFKPDKETGRGRIAVSLPTCEPPIMNAMTYLYLPKRGKYDDFGGTLQVVESFKELRTQALAGRQIVTREAEQGAQRAQEVAQQKLEQSSPAGVSPIKVKLPISGQVLKLQKILVLGEELTITLRYKGWPGSGGWLW